MSIINFFLLIFSLLITLSKSMFFKVESQTEECIFQRREIKETFNIIYYISGEYEKENRIAIKDPDGKDIWLQKNKKHDNVRLPAKKAGKYTFCVENTSKKDLLVTFDFQKENRTQFLTINNIENFDVAVKDIKKKMSDIQFGIRNTAFRRIAHRNIASAIQSKITLVTTLKLLFLFILGMVQIRIVMNMFGNVKVQSNIKINDDENEKLKSKGNKSIIL